MIGLYDNGYKLIGNKKDIKNHTNKMIERMEKVGDNYVIETYQEILDIIKDYENDTIFMIDYTNGMGFTWETWEESDKIKGDQ